jgi:membrane peptidoglycan carboxypeptidase
MFRKDTRKTVDVGIVGLFKNVEESYTDKPATKVRKSLGAVAMLVVVSVVMGLLLTIVPLFTLSTGVRAAEPAVDLWKSLPSELPEVKIGESNHIYDKNGDKIAEVWVENREPLDSLDKISPHAINALIDTEDKRFYEHNGIDARGTLRAFLSNSGGGSGITQQLVKNLQFYDMAGNVDEAEALENSYGRKLRELKLAFDYEEKYSKDEILLQYFNLVAFGGPNTYSIESAANYFFDKPAKDLNINEASLLVGSVQNPNMYNLANPDKHEAAKKRQGEVLARMQAEGSITEAEAKKAHETPIKVTLTRSGAGNCATSKYPFYCDYTMDHLSSSPRLGETQEVRDAILARGGLHIKTYMDPADMAAIDKQLEADFGNKNRVVAPVAIVEPGTGGISAMGVNRDYGSGEGKTTINVAANGAGTGSAFKPFTLAAALENGYTEGRLAFSSSCPYAPRGYDYPRNGFRNSQGCGGFQSGYLDYKQATAYSSNTWYLTLAANIGLDKVYDMSERVGLPVPERFGARALSFVIGSAEYSTIDMAAAYATFANQGVYCPPTPVESYEYSDGTSPVVPDTYNPADDSCKRAMTPNSASVVLKSLRANTVPGEVRGAFSTNAHIEGYDAVGKSGTNQHFSYAWGQVSANASFFMNIYDMDEVNRGVVGSSFRGVPQRAYYAAEAGSSVFAKVLADTKNVPLDYNNKDRSFEEIPVESRDYFTVPSVLGMSPAEALDTMLSMGVEAHVSKEIRELPAGFPEGVIVSQSVEAGTQLPVGTEKEILLYVGSVNGAPAQNPATEGEGSTSDNVDGAQE